ISQMTLPRETLFGLDGAHDRAGHDVLVHLLSIAAKHSLDPKFEFSRLRRHSERSLERYAILRNLEVDKCLLHRRFFPLALGQEKKFECRQLSIDDPKLTCDRGRLTGGNRERLTVCGTTVDRQRNVLEMLVSDGSLRRRLQFRFAACNDRDQNGCRQCTVS